MSLFRRSLTAAVVGTVALSGLSLHASAEESGPARVRVDKPQMPVVARGLIVKTATAEPSKSLLKATDAALGSDVSVAGSEKLLGKISTVDFDESVPAAVAAEAAADLTKRSDVVWAAPNTRRHSESKSPVPKNDKYFPEQTNLWDSVTKSPAGGYSIKAPALWRRTEGHSGVVVAVVDTGVRAEHPDLAGQLVAGYDMIGEDRAYDEFGNEIESDSPTYHVAGDGGPRDNDPSDPGDWTAKGECGEFDDGTLLPAEKSSWHGTHVAGIIAAKAGNKSLIAGAAPGVKVQPVRVLGRCGGWDSDVIAGLTWASGGHVDGVEDNATPAKVVNLSLGGTYPDDAEPFMDEICSAYADAASAGRERGSVFVAAAGNDFGNADLAVPASCGGYLSVGATSTKGFASSYSNYGTSVDLSAPGGDTIVEGGNDSILSLVNRGTKGPVSGGSTYRRYQGTSMAAPEISAGAALLYSLGLSDADEVEDALLASVANFRPRVSSYAKKKVKIDGETYVFDLNCAGHDWCGRGILDLSKVQAPLSGPDIIGNAVIGEPLKVTPGAWVGSPKEFRYQWFREGSVVGESPTYYPTQDDAGARLSVEVRSSVDAYAKFTGMSPETTVVPDGPEVTLSEPPLQTTYGESWTATVNVAGENVEDGVVELRRGSTVLAVGQTLNGTVELTVTGDKWIAGNNLIRAAYVGAGATGPASSSSQLVTVDKASAVVDATLPTTVKVKSKAKLAVTVQVTGIANPTGGISVYDGSKKIVRTSLSASAGGKKTITLPLLKKGTHSIKVVYAGNANISGATSVVLRIKAK